jgi:plastocyanin
MRKTRIGLLLFSLGLVASACGSSTSPASTSTTAATGSSKTITIQGYAFSPTTLSVPVGTKVIVTNRDSVPHTWTSDNGTFDSGTLDQGQSYSFTFTTAGSYRYHCTVHPYMVGTVSVTS